MSLGSILKSKVLIIFIIPILSLVSFAYYLIMSKQNELHQADIYALAADITNSESQLIHNIQVERDYSIVYLLDEDCRDCKENLLKQYRLTDNAIKEYTWYIYLKTQTKHDVQTLMHYKNKPRVKKLLRKIKLLKNTRDSVISGTLDIERASSYYTYMNKQLLEQIYSFTTFTYKGHTGPSNIYQIQQLKENDSIEGLYIYRYLLGKTSKKNLLKRIAILEIQEEKYLDEFQANYPQNEKIYDIAISTKHNEEIEVFKRALFEDKQDEGYVEKWTKLNRKKIENLEKVSAGILMGYKEYVEKIYLKAKNTLNIMYFMLYLSLLSFLLSMYIFRKHLLKEDTLLEELRITASSFDAHEAMVISDAESKIIRVNEAFTRITGYDPVEIVGKRLRDINDTKKNNDIFYSQIHEKLQESGYWSGEIESASKGREYMVKASIAAIKDDENRVTHFISQFLDITNLKRAEKEAIYQATHDFLTQLPNRKSMMQRLQEESSRAIRHHYFNTFLFIDIDDFKKINDQYGHAIGDKLLIAISEGIKSHIRVEDYVARISGDEFCIMLLDMGQSKEKAASAAKIVCEKLLALLSYPFIIDEQKIQISASIGVKLFPDKDSDINDIINDADTAMYRVKNSGKNSYIFFNKEIEDKINSIKKMEKEISQALKKNEFFFHFQPKVDLQTEAIVGAELLVRWMHPTGDIYYPDSFLEIAYSMKAIPQITIMALHKACRFLDKYRSIYHGTLSINITACEFAMEGFIEQIKSIILNYEIDPARIELELVENELIEDFDLIISNMHKLKAFGVKFAIDDFGRGYSSISYLQKLPVDTLKIDRYFMEGLEKIENQELVKMIINIGKTFHMNVVIEGIETSDQLAFVKAYHADQYQGYFFSRPIEEKAFLALIVKTRSL